MKMTSQGKYHNVILKTKWFFCCHFYFRHSFLHSWIMWKNNCENLLFQCLCLELVPSIFKQNVFNLSFRARLSAACSQLILTLQKVNWVWGLTFKCYLTVLMANSRCQDITDFAWPQSEMTHSVDSLSGISKRCFFSQQSHILTYRWQLWKPCRL